MPETNTPRLGVLLQYDTLSDVLRVNLRTMLDLSLGARMVRADGVEWIEATRTGAAGETTRVGLTGAILWAASKMTPERWAELAGRHGLPAEVVRAVADWIAARSSLGAACPS